MTTHRLLTSLTRVPTLLHLSMAALILSGCAAVSPGLESLDPPALMPQGLEPTPPPAKPGTKIKGTVGAGPGTMELTDAAGDKAFVHVDKDGNVDGFVAKENFQPVTATLELNDRSKHTWNWRDGKWRPPSGAGVASASTAAIGSGFGSSPIYSFLGSTEFIVGGGYVTGIGATGGNARSNFADTSGKGDHLSGGSLSILLRSFVPYQLFGIRLGGFLEYDEFFSLDGTSGLGVHHRDPDTNDTKTIRKVNRAFAFGLTQVFPIGMGFFIDLQQGIAFVRQNITGVTDQSSGGGPTEQFSKNFTSVSPKLGASLEYQFPNMPFRVRLASEFIYLPSAGISGFATFSGSPFAFSSRGQWLATNTFGLVVPLNVFSRLN